MTVVVTRAEEALPLEIEMQDTVCSNLETSLNNRSNWPFPKCSGFNSRKSTPNTGRAPISNNASRAGSKHVLGAIKTGGGLDVAGKVVDYTATCHPKTVSRTMHGSLRESMPRPTSTRSAECRISGLFPMDDFDLPKGRDAQFRSLVMVDTVV